MGIESGMKLTLNPGTIPPRSMLAEVRCGLVGSAALWVIGKPLGAL